MIGEGGVQVRVGRGWIVVRLLMQYIFELPFPNSIGKVWLRTQPHSRF